MFFGVIFSATYFCFLLYYSFCCLREFTRGKQSHKEGVSNDFELIRKRHFRKTKKICLPDSKSVGLKLRSGNAFEVHSRLAEYNLRKFEDMC